jgi:phage terminase large subunit-like protein
VTTGGRTFDNPHLPAAFIAAIHARYGGSRLARQELNGEYLAEADGALWTRDLIEARRCDAPGELERVVIGVDPPASDSGDACGIVVCGALADGRCVVLADCSVAGRRPEGWARAVADAAEAWGADRIVAESNNGGQMIASVIHAVAPGLPVSPVHASRGKGARAEPVAVLFETGGCLFAGSFPALEDELSAMTVAGFAGGGSPDRADAMIWAMTALARRPVAPRIRSL